MEAEEKEIYTWQEFAEDVEKIVQLIKESGREFKNIYGPPRGGLVLGVCLSHRLETPHLKVPLIIYKEEITENTLIVDDIADTGFTLLPWSYVNFIVTLFYHKQSVFVPKIWLREKHDKYIRFPWEK